MIGAAMSQKFTFDMICTNCESLGISIDDPVNAPDEAIIRCKLCNAPRGTMGSLRELAGVECHAVSDL
jgi:hypothetical protein